MTTPPSSRDTIASAYDAVAVEYLALARDGFDRLPLDRALLTAFAQLTPPGTVLEAGCGPGLVTEYLHEAGLDIGGVDVSATMIALARQAYPRLRFAVGSMDALDTPDASLSGLVAWYSIIHTPPAELPSFFAEFHRVLAAGGQLLLGFFEAEADTVTSFDHKVTTAYRWPITELAALARDAGFAEVARMSREPLAAERFRRGHLILTKPGA